MKDNYDFSTVNSKKELLTVSSELFEILSKNLDKQQVNKIFIPTIDINFQYYKIQLQFVDYVDKSFVSLSIFIDDDQQTKYEIKEVINHDWTELFNSWGNFDVNVIDEQYDLNQHIEDIKNIMIGVYKSDKLRYF